MKQYFMEYESDRKVCGGYSHVWGFASSIKTAERVYRQVQKAGGGAQSPEFPYL